MIAFVKFIPELHYDIISSWWDGHKWPIIPVDSLPRTGYIAMYNNKPVCSGFLYKTDSNIAWMEWIVCDPNASRDYRGDCIDSLIMKLADEAATMGYTNLFTSVCNHSLINRLEREQFQISDKNMTNLVKVLH